MPAPASSPMLATGATYAQLAPPRDRQRWVPSLLLLVPHVAVLALIVVSLRDLQWIHLSGDGANALREFGAGFLQFCASFPNQPRVCLPYSTSIADALTTLKLPSTDSASSSSTICDAPSAFAMALGANSPSFAWLDTFFSAFCGSHGTAMLLLMECVCALGALALLAAVVILCINANHLRWRRAVSVVGALSGGIGSLLLFAVHLTWEYGICTADAGASTYSANAKLLLVWCVELYLAPAYVGDLTIEIEPLDKPASREFPMLLV